MSSQTWRGKREAQMASRTGGPMGIRDGHSEFKNPLYNREFNKKVEIEADDMTAFNDFLNESGEPKEPEFGKVLQVETKKAFEKELNQWLAKGWIINPGESLKIFNRTYTILLTKPNKNKKYI